VSRNANETSAAIFSRLTEYAADHEVSIPIGERRIFLDEDQYNALVGSKKVKHFSIGRHQAAALLQTSAGGDILAVCGFDTETISSSSHVREAELSPGITVAAIADLAIEPTASALDVLNVVAAGSTADAEYQGHECDKVLDLFPRIRVLEIDPDAGGAESFFANLLTVCAAESAAGNGWINDPLSNELVRLAEQRIAGFPYEFLVMATLELDPRNLFLALYRCLEATYAFTRASELVTKLGVTDKSWFEVAKALGESLSWYPRHDQSLAAVLSLPAVNPDDLDALAVSLGKDQGGEEVAIRVAAGVRDLRNSLVHYGPTTRPAAVPDDDWNRLCIPLAKVVGSVFAHTYGGVATGGLWPQPATAAVNPSATASQTRRFRVSRGIAKLHKLARRRPL